MVHLLLLMMHAFRSWVQLCCQLQKVLTPAMLHMRVADEEIQPLTGMCTLCVCICGHVMMSHFRVLEGCMHDMTHWRNFLSEHSVIFTSYSFFFVVMMQLKRELMRVRRPVTCDARCTPSTKRLRKHHWKSECVDGCAQQHTTGEWRRMHQANLEHRDERNLLCYQNVLTKRSPHPGSNQPSTFPKQENRCMTCNYTGVHTCVIGAVLLSATWTSV